ncbi:MAG TPA: GAF domain-containing protein [Anaerolineales bacterium]|nr:GAF domain-containing protein [Anaerolineales bacterium]
MSNRETRNALYCAVAILLVAFLSLISVSAASISSSPLLWAEEITLLGLVIVSIVSIVEIYRGQRERSIWNLIYALLIVAALRTILRESIGLPFGILTAILIATTSYLSLPPNEADRANILGYTVSGLIVAFDLYADFIYTRQPSPASLINLTSDLTILVVIFHVIIIMAQARSLNLAARVANLFSLFSLVTVFVIGYLSISAIQSSLAASQIQLPIATTSAIENLQRGVILVGTLIVVIGAILGTVITRVLTTPLNRLIDTSTKITHGSLSARTAIETNDEFGQLGQAFNEMAERLDNTVNELEARVAERTRDLERRAIQLQTAAEIGNTAAQMLSLDQLLTHAARLISERFGFYHTGIFLLDEHQEYAVLRAANSLGGQHMLARHHQLKIGEVGIVGFATGTGQPRIALNVGQDAVFFDNPDLPETRSEMALPLIAGGKILGALDVQSTEESAFTQEDISTLQVLADQLAVAIENARLFEENQKTLEAVRNAYGELSQSAWRRLQKATGTIGYISLAQGKTVSVKEAEEREAIPDPAIERPTVSDDGKTLFMPVKIRNLTIGMIRLTKPDHAPSWIADEIAAATALNDQISNAVESARLYQEAQRRAVNERQTAAIINQIRSSTVMDTIMQTAVRELAKTLGTTRAYIQMSVPTADKPDDNKVD